MKTSLPLFLLILLWVSGLAEASVTKSPFVIEFMNLGRLIQLYQDQEGKYPTSWNQFEKQIPGLDKTFPLLTPTQRMALISPPIQLPPRFFGGGLAVAMTRDSYRPLSQVEWPIIGTHQTLKPPVYGVILVSDGGVTRKEIPTDVMISFLNSQGLAMPQPSGLGRFPHEKEFLIQKVFNWAVVVAFCSWLIWRMVRRLKKRASEQPVTDKSEQPS